MKALNMGRLAAIATAIALGACGEQAPEIDCSDACACIDPDSTLMPWPSDCYTQADPTSATGLRVAIPRELMPANLAGPADPAPWNDWDGFSAMTSMIVELPDRIDASTLPLWTDDAPGLADDSPTVLLDAATGERVAHFAEIEESAEADPSRTTLYVRPAARLQERTRYVVAIRGLEDTAGVALAPSDAFAALREHPSDAFEAEVLAPLGDAGVSREELVLAWTFTTGSGEHAWGDLVHMASEALELAGEDGLGCAVTRTDDSLEGYTVVDGTFTVPMFLASEEPGAPMLRGADGQPAASGTVEASFRAVIPDAVAEAVRADGVPASVVVYGHGLFDNRGKVSRPGDDGRTPPLELAAMCGDQIWVATDFLGLASMEEGLAIQGLTDLSTFDMLFDRVRQGLINTLLLPRTFARQCGELDELRVDGQRAIDLDERYYYGNSQGSILGTTLAALSPDIERFALGVGGISYPIMLPRSVNWPGLEVIFAMAYPDRLTRDLAMVMFAQRWDLVEGAAFAPHVLDDPLPGMRTRPARLLYQVGLHDVQTPNVASEIAARTMGLPQEPSSPDPVWGLETRAGSSDSAYILHDAGAAPVGRGTLLPTERNGVHEAVRRDPAMQAQVCQFLQPEGAVEMR